MRGLRYRSIDVTKRIARALRMITGAVAAAVSGAWRRARRPRSGLGAIMAVVGIAMTGLVLWALTTTHNPANRARQYLTFKACLLTDSQGITGKQAAQVWAGMEQASLRTRARIQYLPAFGPATVANTRPYLNSLIQRRCNIIIAVGDIPVATVTAEASRRPTTHFVVITERATGPNITTVKATLSTLASAISDTIGRAMDNS
jgi:hypothetical protein